MNAILFGCLISALASFSSAEFKCGISNVTGFPFWRIIGGVDAKKGEFPWQVSIKSSSGTSHNCGGTIVSDQWILTAAHCGNTPLIVLGDYNLKTKESEEVEERDFIKWIRHPQDGGNFRNQHDVALIKLKEPLDFDGKHRHLAAICLADDQDDEQFENTHCVASGWGYAEGHVLPDILQKVRLPVLKNEVCFPIFHKMGLDISERIVCAGGEDIKSICNGDSGGPLQCQRKDGSWTQVGITSFVKTYCGPNTPAGFTRVSKFRQWILDTIAKE